MMFSSSPTDRPLYSFIAATSHPSYIYDISDSSSSSPSPPTSVDSDIENIAQKLGITDISDLHSERFQIDRRKLEKMIKTPTQVLGTNSAVLFFENIMKTTDTFISWPRNLKINARSRKDPFIRIMGRPNDINWAQGLILASLSTRGPIIRIKMLISNSDHPYIIGRNGSNVNHIMDETETHIHFPDSNRRSLAEKSNQVSLYGTIFGIERARKLLRSSAPLVMSFELPMCARMPRHNRPFIRQLETTYNVKIIFFPTAKTNIFVAIVKGTENEANELRKATQELLQLTCGAMAVDTQVSIQMEICQQLHDTIKADDSDLLSAIMDYTETKIIITESTDMTWSSQITITGSVEGIYKAKQELMNNFIIELTFEIANNNNSEEIMSFQSKYGVEIAIQQKQRGELLSITIKQCEAYIRHIYEAYEEIYDSQIIANELTTPRAYLLVEPAFRRKLESNIYCGLSNSESIPLDIWAPIDSESNFLQVSPSSAPIPAPPPVEAPISLSPELNFSNNLGSLLNGGYEYQQAEPQVRLSPDSTGSSEAAYQEGRRSSDWVLMKEREDLQYESDFDPEDLEVAAIFMSSPLRDVTFFASAPGAERQNGW